MSKPTTGVFSQHDCVNSAASYKENQETPDTVRVSSDCPQGYTWLDVTRFGDIWRVTHINAA